MDVPKMDGIFMAAFYRNKLFCHEEKNWPQFRIHMVLGADWSEH